MNSIPPSDLYAANRAAVEWFARVDAARVARNYLASRGVNTAYLPGEFLIGYAARGWTGLIDHLRGRGFSDEVLLAAGLAKLCSRGTLIDVFRDRVTFAIHNEQGMIAGFTGRDLSGRSVAKYLNTRETPVFHKSELLYGLYEVTADAPFVTVPVLVEGPLDVLAITAAQNELAARGDPPELLAVAGNGTALSQCQAQQLADHVGLFGDQARHAPPVVVALDGDRAGRTATLRSGDLLRAAGADVRIAALPNGMDPAEIITKHPRDLGCFRRSATLPLEQVATETLIARVGARIQWVEGKVEAIRSVAGYLSAYPRTTALAQVRIAAAMINLSPTTAVAELATAIDAVGGRFADTAEDRVLAAGLAYGHTPDIAMGEALEGAMTRWAAITGISRAINRPTARPVSSIEFQDWPERAIGIGG
jgi:DNA primase